MAKCEVSLNVDMSKVRDLIDDMIFWSTIKGLAQWISGYCRLFDNLPGDLFEVKTERKGKLSIAIIPTDEFIKFHDEARRRYEKLDS